MSPRAPTSPVPAPAAAPARKRPARVRMRVRGEAGGDDAFVVFNDLVVWLNANAGADLPTVDQLQGPLVTLWEAPLSDTTPPERGVPWSSRLEIAWQPIPPAPFAIACRVHVLVPPELSDAGRRRRR